MGLLYGVNIKTTIPLNRLPYNIPKNYVGLEGKLPQGLLCGFNVKTAFLKMTLRTSSPKMT